VAHFFPDSSDILPESNGGVTRAAFTEMRQIRRTATIAVLFQKPVDRPVKGKGHILSRGGQLVFWKCDFLIGQPSHVLVISENQVGVPAICLSYKITAGETRS
jgi:hypothetical protein